MLTERKHDGRCGVDCSRALTAARRGTMAAALMNVHSYSTAACVSELIMELHPVAIDTNYRTPTLKSL